MINSNNDNSQLEKKTFNNRSVMNVDVQSAKQLCWIRLGAALISGVLSTFFFLLDSTSLSSFALQFSVSLFLATYSFAYLFYFQYRIRSAVVPYILSFLDIGVVTGLLWSLQIGGNDSGFLMGAVFGAYLLVILSTALHPRSFLSISCGFAIMIVYFLMNLKTLQLPDLFVNLALFLMVSVLSAVVSINNHRTLMKEVFSDVRYHNLVHRLPEMIFTLDAKGNVLWTNSASYSLTGLPARALIGKNLKRFMARPDSFRLDPKGLKGTFEMQDANNNHKFVDCILQFSTGDTSQPVYEGIISDVTDRELAISQREEMVNRLFQYQKMESLGTLASGMAHDFNNILQTVKDITGLVSRQSSEEETKRRMELIDETITDAKFLVSELFALGRKKPFDHRAVNLNDLVKAVVPQYSNQLGERYDIELKNCSQECWVQGEPNYLKRVFQNLFGNARDAMPEGGSITVELDPEETKNNGTVILRVGDMGTGIPEELKEKIFDPFFSTKKPGKGTGLGLALVRRIIMLHNGNVFVEKSNSTGTVFRIELPLSGFTEPQKRKMNQKSMDRKSCTVLLLDDDPKIREVLRFFLKEFRYPVCEASDCDEARVELSRNARECQVLVMDWNIGNDNPAHVIRSLREIREDLVVIVVSGYLPQKKKIEQLDIRRWFTKPYDKYLLDLEIQKALTQAASPQENSEKDETVPAE
ncbi:MAG: ATP-binding protein [Chitinispirillaceae bacterium]